MRGWELPTSLQVGGRSWKIRSDYRAILDILSYFNDPEYDAEEKWLICLDILFEDFQDMPYYLYTEAEKAASDFIDMGIKDDGKPKPSLMDWEKDAPIMIPPINRSLGKEVRSLEYLHWWSFLSAYLDIGDGLFTQILSIRSKIAKRKRLEKWEQDFYRENKHLIDLDSGVNDQEEEDFWSNLLK